MSTLGALAGEYWLRPGATPALVGQRPIVLGARLGRWLRGHRGDAVPRMLGQVFSVCAHAHRLTARLALAAARGEGAVPSAAQRAWLQHETARDHLRALALDWPALSGFAAANLEWLQGCPLDLGSQEAETSAQQATQALAKLAAWWEAKVLHQALPQWLAMSADTSAWERWCAARAPDLPPAACLHHWSAMDVAHQALPYRPLWPHGAEQPDAPGQIAALAQAMWQQEDFAAAPLWHGAGAETGAWTRCAGADRRPSLSALDRLKARWVECVQLACDAHTACAPLRLACGALSLDQGRAVAWCEMARGLLLHSVEIDADGAVQDYRIVAPTDWNFSPQGALAAALAALRADQTQEALLLAGAFDACAPCAVQTHTAPEINHA